MSEIPKQVNPEGQLNAVEQPVGGFDAALDHADAYTQRMRSEIDAFKQGLVGDRLARERAEDVEVADAARRAEMDSMITGQDLKSALAAAAIKHYAQTGEHNDYTLRAEAAADKAVTDRRAERIKLHSQTTTEDLRTSLQDGVVNAFNDYFVAIDKNGPAGFKEANGFSGWFGKGAAGEQSADPSDLGALFGAGRKADATEKPTIEVSFVDPAPAQEKPADKPAGDKPTVVEGSVVPEPRTAGEDAPTDGKAVGRASVIYPAGSKYAATVTGRTTVPTQPQGETAVPTQSQGETDLASILNEPTQVLPVIKKSETPADLGETPAPAEADYDQGYFPLGGLTKNMDNVYPALFAPGRALSEELGTYPAAYGKPEQFKIAEGLDIKVMGKKEQEFMRLMAKRNQGEYVDEAKFFQMRDEIDADQTKKGLATQLFDRFSVDGLLGRSAEAAGFDPKDIALSKTAAEIIKVAHEHDYKPTAKLTDRLRKLVDAENKRGAMPVEFYYDEKGDLTPVRDTKLLGRGDVILEAFTGGLDAKDAEIKMPANTSSRLRRMARAALTAIGIKDPDALTVEQYNTRQREMWAQTDGFIPSAALTNRRREFIDNMPASELKFVDPALVEQQLGPEAAARFRQQRARRGYGDEYKGSAPKGRRNIVGRALRGVERPGEAMVEAQPALGPNPASMITPEVFADLTAAEKAEARRQVREYYRTDGFPVNSNGSSAVLNRTALNETLASIDRMTPAQARTYAQNREYVETMFPNEAVEALKHKATLPDNQPAPAATPAARPNIVQVAPSVGESSPATYYTLGEQSYINRQVESDRKPAEAYVASMRARYSGPDADTVIAEDAADVANLDPAVVEREVESGAYLARPQQVSDALRARYDQIMDQRMDDAFLPWEDDDNTRVA